MTRNQRTEYGKALVELGKEDSRIVALDADLSRSTMSCLFEEQFPSRFFEMGIAEQNMASFAAGLSLAGRVPFLNTFAVFATGRAYDQIRQSIGTAGANVKIVGSSAGLSDFGDGATHQAIEDAAIMSAIPGMTVLTPCDGVETRLATRWAAAHDGPVYLRLSRTDMEDMYPENVPYAPGKPVVLTEGGDITIFTQGILAREALTAAKILAGQRVFARVVHLTGLKPMEDSAVADLCEDTRCAVVAEEHSLFGGLCAKISMILREKGYPIGCVAIDNRFGQSGESHIQLLECYGLTAPHIVEKALEAIGKRRK